jgi:rSAM/selenodomain-associated transferase 2
MKLSIVIPTLNEAQTISNTLRSLAAQRVPIGNSLELIIVDGGSTDNTAETVERFFETNTALPVRMFLSAKGRAVQMNCGADVSTGDALFFLHADSELSPNALASLVAALSKPDVQFGFFSMRFDSAHPLAERYAAATSLNTIFTNFGDGGFFMRRAFFFDLGKFPSQELMEDVEFHIRAKAKTEPYLISEAFITTSARRFEQNGFLRQQLTNIGLTALYLFGVRPSVLKKFY